MPLLLLLSIFPLGVFSREDYETSLFGACGKNEVAIEYVDGYTVLGDVPKPPDAKYIKELKLTPNEILDAHYPWPGHNFVGGYQGKNATGTCYFPDLLTETDALIKKYTSNSLTQATMYRHPAAPQQYYTTWADLDKAPRKVVRYTISPVYNRHYLHAFAPPGEVVSITLLKGGVGKVSLTFNLLQSSFSNNTEGVPKYYQRLPNMRISVSLSQNENFVGSPYGGQLSVSISGSDPIELLVSGVILCPHFKYGVHSDEEWENELSKNPGPVAEFDTGNMHIDGYSSQIRNTFRMNDCMKFWRSAYQISQTTAKDNYNGQDGRVSNILQMHCETFVPAGSAVAIVGANFCVFNPATLPGFTTFTTLQGNPWGIVHEMNHHHQQNWANGVGDEMSNNVLNLVIYAVSNCASSGRTESGGLSSWPSYSHSNQMLNSPGAGNGLSMYSTLIQFFGYKRFKKYVRADQKNLLYNKNNASIGMRGAQMLKMSYIFRRDLRYYFNYHGFSDAVLANHENGTDSDTLTFRELERLNLRPFHPVTNAYACGFIVDGERFEMARPFRIPPVDKVIDFNTSINYIKSDKEKFGEFVFRKAHFEKGRENAWKFISEGRYLLTPKSNYFEKEEVIVDYFDLTTNETHQVICKFEQYLNNGAEYELYNNFTDITSVFEAYKYYSTDLRNQVDPISKTFQTMLYSPRLNGDKTGVLTIVSGLLTPPSSGDYYFATAADKQGLFYLSEEPLNFDPDLDKKSLAITQTTTITTYGGNKSAKYSLDKTKAYYYALITFSPPGATTIYGQCGFVLNNVNGTYTSIPGSWLKFKDISAKDVYVNQYKPTFEDIYYLDYWQGQNFVYELIPKMVVYKYPVDGDRVINSDVSQGTTDNSKDISSALNDHDPTTEYRTKWWTGKKPEFPHIYELDCENIKFKYLKIGGTGNTGYFDMSCYLEIYLAPYNYSINIGINETIPYDKKNYSLNHEESLIYEGNYDTKNCIIEFDKYHQGRYLRLVFVNNSKKWKDNNIGRTSISSVEIGHIVHNLKVIPSTNVEYIKYTGCEETRDGCYYNGKGLNCSRGAEIIVKSLKGKREIGILGDIWNKMGEATVLLNNAQDGYINNSLIKIDDLKRLDLSSRSHKQIIYYRYLDSGRENTITIKVNTGNIIIAGLLYDDNYTAPPVKEWDRDDFSDYLEYLENKDKTPGNDSDSKHGKTNGKAIGIAVGVIVVIGVVVAVAVVTQIKFHWIGTLKDKLGSLGKGNKKNAKLTTTDLSFDL